MLQLRKAHGAPRESTIKYEEPSLSRSGVVLRRVHDSIIEDFGGVTEPKGHLENYGVGQVPNTMENVEDIGRHSNVSFPTTIASAAGIEPLPSGGVPR